MNDTGTATPELIEQLLQKEEIRSVLHRFCRGLDRLDRDLLTSCFHPDATEDHGGVTGPARELHTPEALAKLPRVMHHCLGQIDVVLTGATAGVESYLVVTMVAGTDEDITSGLVAVRFVDRFEKRDAEWRIAHRTAVFDVQATLTGGLPQVPQASQGRQDRQDPVYQLFTAE